MNILEALIGLGAFVLLAYLFLALLKPEIFG